MSDTQGLNSYASGINISFDEARDMFVGTVVSCGRTMTVEGRSETLVQLQLEEIVKEEYNQLVREVEGRPQSKERSRSRWSFSNSGSVHPQNNKSHETNFHRRHKARSLTEKPALFLGKLLTDMAIDHMIGNVYISAALSLADMMSSAESMWNKKPKKMHKAIFGGMVIVAASRKALKKRLLQERRKHVYAIMTHVRSHEKNRDNASTVEKLCITSERLKAKRERAQALRPKADRRDDSPQGQSVDWQGRAIDLKSRLQDKRMDAMDMMLERNV